MKKFKFHYYFLVFLLLVYLPFSFVTAIEIPKAYSAEEESNLGQENELSTDSGLISQESVGPNFSQYIMPIFGGGIMGGPPPSYKYTLEGLIASGNPNTDWTTGNLCQGGGDCYSEGDNVPSRLTIEGLTIGNHYSVIIGHDYKDSNGTIGYENFNRVNTILPDSNVTGVSINYISPDVTCGSNICKNYNLDFWATDSVAIIYWNSLLSLQAADWNGSKLHYRLDEGIGGENVGEKIVPITVNQISYLPSLTLTKVVDAGSAKPDEWSFNVSPSINGQSQFDIPDGEDSVTIPNVPDGDYNITESNVANYQFNLDGPNTNCKFTGSTATATVSAGDPATDASCTFHNILSVGMIEVHKEVLNPDGNQVSDISPEFVINLDDADPQPIHDGETVTYNNVLVGAHTIKEITIPGNYDLHSITPDGDGILANGGQVNVVFGQITHVDVVNYQKKAKINVFKDVFDPNGDPISDNHNFLVELNGQDQKTISESGQAHYEVNPGSGFSISELNDSNYEELGCRLPTGGLANNFSLSSGEEIKITCENKQQKGSIIVIKYRDINQNGIKDLGEQALSGWDIHLDGVTETTSLIGGEVVFSDLLPDDYDLSETQKDGWQLTGIYCDNEIVTTGLASIQIANSHNVKLGSNETVHCYVGNYYTNPSLIIEKTNNKLGIGLLAGDSVEYIITVRAENNFVDDVFVKDTLPIGFSFRDDSYKVESSIRGDITGTIVAPSYNSMAATWNLGKIEKDEVITISYIADISGSQDPGVYPDNAWTSGKDYFGDVLGLAGVQGMLDTNFVGTEVKVIVQEGITSYNTEQKVRALPATGPSVILVIIGGAFLFLLYTFLASRRRRKATKTIASIILMLVLTSFYLISYASAASINVRLESPKTPTSESNFKINFVAQDLQQRSGFAAKCYKQGPADVSFNQFGSDINFNGGISSFCDLSSSPLMVEGAYNFKVEIIGAEAAESNIVSVQFIAGVPGTPTNYLKTQNGCNYTIDFRTADDGGKTVRTEIYMSSSKSFIVGPETMVKNIIVGSSQNVSSTITVPDCSINHFFAVRAFDAADNASGIIGDIEIVTIDEFGRIVLASIAPGLVSSTGAVGGAETGGEAQGTSASLSASPSTSESVSPSPSGEVKGDETKEAGINKYKFLYWLIPLVVIVAILFLWWWRRRRGNKDNEDFEEEI